MSEPVKKVLKIKKGEYLLEIRNNAVATTYSLEHAMDIREWSLDQLGYIISNLKNVGYTKASVVDVFSEEYGEETEEHKSE